MLAPQPSACPGASSVSLDVALSVPLQARVVASGYRWVYARLPAVNGVDIPSAYPPTPGADAFEVRVAHSSDPSAPFLSQLCDARASTCTIDDLLPATAYVVLVRERLRGYWTAPTRARLCRTLALSRRQPRLLPPSRRPGSDSVSVTVEVAAADAAAFTGHVALQYRRSGTAAWTDYPSQARPRSGSSWGRSQTRCRT